MIEPFCSLSIGLSDLNDIFICFIALRFAADYAGIKIGLSDLESQCFFIGPVLGIGR